MTDIRTLIGELVTGFQGYDGTAGRFLDWLAEQAADPVGAFHARADELGKWLELADAAPELLAALEGVIYFHDTDDTPNIDPWTVARAAIAKAKGNAQ